MAVDKADWVHQIALLAMTCLGIRPFAAAALLLSQRLVQNRVQLGAQGRPDGRCWYREL